jgi:hypothetical protein
LELQSDKPTLHKLVCRYPESVLIYITYVLGFFASVLLQIVSRLQPLELPSNGLSFW